jgi:hypothetical protein
MAVVVALADADAGHPRPESIDESLRGGGAAAVVGHLQEVQAGAVGSDAVRQEPHVDVVLDIAREQEAALAESDVEDEGRIVDRATAARGPLR